MEVFRIVFDKCTTVVNAIEGFKKSIVFPWNPAIINDKNLPLQPCLKIKSQLPDVNMSINEDGPETSEKPKEDTRTENVTETIAEVHEEDPKLKEAMGMAVTICPNGLLKEVIIDEVRYAITPLDEPKEASVPTISATVPVTSAKQAEIVNEVLTMPMVKKKKTLGVCLLKIPRCISSKEFQNLIREREDTKDKEEEEKEDHKRMRQAKAEEKKRQQQVKQEKWELTKVKKAKVVAIKALAAPRLKRISNDPEDYNQSLSQNPQKKT